MPPAAMATSSPISPAEVASAYGSRAPAVQPAESSLQSSLLYRNIHEAPRHVVASKGSFLTLSNGLTILDASCGAAVACLGHDNARVKEAINHQVDQVSYCLSTTLGTDVAEKLAEELCAGTGGLMSKAYIVGSGE
jgi:adenosylmethionine-8-amino-7-oxononanoate aminotransferase